MAESTVNYVSLNDNAAAAESTKSVSKLCFNEDVTETDNLEAFQHESDTRNKLQFTDITALDDNHGNVFHESQPVLQPDDVVPSAAQVPSLDSEDVAVGFPRCDIS